MFKLKTYRSRARGLPDLLPYAALIEPDIVLCKDGSLLAAWEIRGADTESSTDDELAAISARVNTAFKEFGSGWMIHVDATRLPTTEYPAREASHFPDRISALMDDARRTTFTSGRYFTTSTTLTVCFKPSGTDAKINKLVGTSVVKEHNALEHHLATFKAALVNIEDALKISLTLSRLGSAVADDNTGGQTVFSALLSSLQCFITGNNYLMRVPHTPMYLDALLGGQDLTGGLLPRIGTQYIAVIAIDGLPSESWPSMLSGLGSLPFASRFSTRYICMDQFEALKEVDKYRKTWAQNIYRFFDKLLNRVNPRPDQNAADMTKDAETAYASLQGGYFNAGFYTANVVLLDEDVDALKEKARLVRRMLMGLGFGARLESINALEAWLSTHPGNWVANVRRPMVSTLNLADFLPLASTWTGSQFCPCPLYPADSPALIQCATDTTTPFWLNLHVDDVGHTLILGPTGAGKSTLLALIAAQFRRYEHAQVFVFDKGMSLYPLCMAVGGQHYNVGGDDSPAFSPLQQVDSDAESTWGEEWLGSLCTLQKLTVLPGHKDAIHVSMQKLRSFPPNMRSLSHFVSDVQNVDVKKYLKHYTREGAMGKLLDAPLDGLGEAPFMVFEIEELMNMGDENALPVLTYLFHVIEHRLTGQPTLIILDEAWIMLGHPIFQAKIREWLKTLRKLNCAVVLATQSLSDATRSSIMDVLNESCPTKIMLPNDKAFNEDAVKAYKKLGLNDRQIELVNDARPKREYYITSPSGRRMVNLALSPVELAFVGASSKEHLKRVQELVKTDANWSETWLRERGVA